MTTIYQHWGNIWPKLWNISNILKYLKAHKEQLIYYTLKMCQQSKISCTKDTSDIIQNWYLSAHLVIFRDWIYLTDSKHMRYGRDTSKHKNEKI